jgi:hypothetical protein
MEVQLRAETLPGPSISEELTINILPHPPPHLSGDKREELHMYTEF